MSETTNNGNSFVGFEYKDVTVRKTMYSVYMDSYKNFGWTFEGNSAPVGKPVSLQKNILAECIFLGCS